MPRLSRLGDVVSSPASQGIARINGIAIPETGAGNFDWIDDDTVGGQINNAGVWETWSFDKTGQRKARLSSGASEFAGGSGWSKYLGGVGIVDIEGFTSAAAGLLARGDDGTRLYVQDRNNPYALLVNGLLAGTWSAYITSAASRRGKHVVCAGAVLYDVPSWQPFACLPIGPQPRCVRIAVTPGGRVFAIHNDGDRLVVYELHLSASAPSGSLQGWVLSTDGKDNNPDLVALDDRYLIGESAVDTGETATRKYQIDVTSATVDLRAPVANAAPIAPFNHPVTVLVFKDPAGQFPAPQEVVVNVKPSDDGQSLDNVQQTTRPCWAPLDSLSGIKGPLVGIYTEQRGDQAPVFAEATSRGVRVGFCWDAASALVLPTGLRPFDTVIVECYRYKTLNESLDQARARWVSTLATALVLHPGDLALCLPLYCMNGIPNPPPGVPGEDWTVAEVDAIVRAGAALVNTSLRIKTVWLFEYLRGNGMSAHPELVTLGRAIVAASPGEATLTPIPQPDPNHTPAPSPARTFEVTMKSIQLVTSEPSVLYVDQGAGDKGKLKKAPIAQLSTAWTNLNAYGLDGSVDEAKRVIFEPAAAPGTYLDADFKTSGVAQPFTVRRFPDRGNAIALEVPGKGIATFYPGGMIGYTATISEYTLLFPKGADGQDLAVPFR